MKCNLIIRRADIRLNVTMWGRESKYVVEESLMKASAGEDGKEPITIYLMNAKYLWNYTYQQPEPQKIVL